MLFQIDSYYKTSYFILLKRKIYMSGLRMGNLSIDRKKKPSNFSKNIRKFRKNETSLDVLDILKTVSWESKYILEFDLEQDDIYFFFIEPMEDVSPVLYSHLF